MLQQWKAPHESLEEFLGCFHLLIFEALNSHMKFQYHMDRFEYCLHKSIYPNEKKKFKTRSWYFGDGVAQSQADTVAITSDCLHSPHQIDPPPQIDVGERAHMSIQLSHPPTPSLLDIYVDLSCKHVGCYMDFFPQPPTPPLILQIVLYCVLLFQTMQVLWTNIELSTKLMLCNQPALSFMMSVCGNLNMNPNKGWHPFVRASFAFSWHLWWLCYLWFPLCKLIHGCTYFRSFVEHTRC